MCQSRYVDSNLHLTTQIQKQYTYSYYKRLDAKKYIIIMSYTYNFYFYLKCFYIFKIFKYLVNFKA